MVQPHPRARSVTPLDRGWVRVVFTDGSTAEVDVRPLLRGPVFERVRDDAAVFAQVRIAEVGGCLEWPGGLDLDPDVLYELATRPTASRADSAAE